MNDIRQKQLIEASWRRALTPEEESELQLHLASHPGKQEEWEDELALTAALHNLRDAPLSSNFTSQVLHAVDREATRKTKAEAASTSPGAWLRRLMPRFAFVAVTVLLMLTGLNAYRMHNQPRDLEVVKSLVSVAASVESPAVFGEDFDAIQQMRTAPEFNDQELVAVLLK